MKIIIIDCLATGKGLRKFSRDFIGGGPKLIAGILNQIGLSDLSIKIARAEEILFKKDAAQLTSYDVLLISAMTMDLPSVQKVIKIWRKNNFEKLVVVGGPIASDLNLLNNLNADISVQGEGETKLTSIFRILLNSDLKSNNMSMIKLKDIDGITFRYKGKVYKTEPSSFLSIEEFNKFSNPVYFLDYIKNYDNYKSARIYVECLRGCSNYYRAKLFLDQSRNCLGTCNNCRKGLLIDRINCPINIPAGCGFCSTINGFGFPKSRNLENITSEIKGLLALGARRIVLGAPDLLDYKREELVKDQVLTSPSIPPELNYEALEALIETLIELKQVKEREAQIFIENVKASLCTERALKILARIPNSIFSIGCETGSDEFAKGLGRPFSPSEALQAIKHAIRFGIRVHVYLIHSLPGEKVEYLKDTINLIKNLYNLSENVEKITIYKYQELPGSPFYILQESQNLKELESKDLERYRKKLINLAINFNKNRKQQMIGKMYDIILSEPSFSNKFDSIGYILQGGPKVLVKNSAKLLGKKAKVKIVRMFSDKIIEGIIVNPK